MFKVCNHVALFFIIVSVFLVCNQLAFFLPRLFQYSSLFIFCFVFIDCSSVLSLFVRHLMGELSLQPASLPCLARLPTRLNNYM